MNVGYPMVSELIKAFRSILHYRQFCVAYSGGLDSHVLLHSLSVLMLQHPDIECRAIHINHGLHPNADLWEGHCQQICLDLGIEFIACKVQLDLNPGESVEAVAREVRYRKFASLLNPEECLVTAHTQNDQAETLLLQLMRGSGVKGLAAMPREKPFAKGFLVRPFLHITRDVLHDYARLNELVWIEDDSNLELRFDRNYVRQRILPALQQRWPKLLTTLTRSADHCAQASQLLDELADQDLQSIQGASKNQLSIESLKKLSELRQRNVLRRWIASNGYRTPNTKQLQQIFKDVLSASEDAKPQLNWDEGEIRRFQNQLFLMPRLEEHAVTQPVFWDFRTPLILPHNLGKLMMREVKGHGISKELDFSKINVRFRCGGEQFCPAGRQGTHSLKKLLQEWNVPPWERDRIPLIYYDNELIAVVGYGVHQNYLAKQDQVGIDIHWDNCI